jgi:ABA4-like protein
VFGGRGMSVDQIFSVANQTALVGWVILIFLPRRWPPLFWLPQFIIPGLLALGYATLALVYFASGDGGFGSITDVRSLFEKDEILLAGWIHYLAFDLFVGAWIARRSDEAGIPRLIQAVFLGFTFMFGPAGFLLFLITRGLMARNVSAGAS